MRYKILTAAMLLGMAIAFPFSKISAVEPVSSVPAKNFLQQQDGLSSSTLTTLIEKHAALYWKITIEDAWTAYNQGALTIVEIGNHLYQLKYSGEVITVLLDDGF